DYFLLLAITCQRRVFNVETPPDRLATIGEPVSMAFKLIFLWLFWLCTFALLLLGFLSLQSACHFSTYCRHSTCLPKGHQFLLQDRRPASSNLESCGPIRTKDLFYTTDKHGNKGYRLKSQAILKNPTLKCSHQQPRLCLSRVCSKQRICSEAEPSTAQKTIGNLSRRQSRSYSATEECEAYRRISAENRPPSSLASSDEFQVSSSHPTTLPSSSLSQTVCCGPAGCRTTLESLNALKSAETVEDEAIEDDDKPNSLVARRHSNCSSWSMLASQLDAKAARLSEAEPLLHDDSDSAASGRQVQLTIRNFPEELISPGRVGARELETVHLCNPTGDCEQCPDDDEALQLRRRQAPPLPQRLMQ
uniref:Uncharacterized protein n=1 Tax=Macrostomum lignano TaxID=282301 RepID=A0A1I8F9T4_9PLAT